LLTLPLERSRPAVPLGSCSTGRPRDADASTWGAMSSRESPTMPEKVNEPAPGSGRAAAMMDVCPEGRAFKPALGELAAARFAAARFARTVGSKPSVCRTGTNAAPDGDATGGGALAGGALAGKKTGSEARGGGATAGCMAADGGGAAGTN
jgi:hypothetical protein